ncbi:IS30 family transposase [Malacoplasma muris]|uniref:IS30 family transposase n=1 Tax=Malacoplasma muris TaxID=2119 RepID=UPI00398E576E
MLYNHLSEKERAIIEFMFYQEKRSLNSIAKELNRHRSTISRELKRNESCGIYNSNNAHKKYLNRKWNSHAFYLDRYKSFTDLFLDKFRKIDHGVEATCHYIKKKIILVSKHQVLDRFFNWIKSNRWKLKRSDRLRKGYVKGRKRHKGMFSKFDEKYVFPFWARPSKIEKREEYGHFEADLIIGKRKAGYSNLLTLVERVTRMTYIIKVKNKNSFTINSTIKKLVEENNLEVKTITIDNGIEFNKIGILAYWLNCKIYYCEPYASFQRGSNENANGIIRRFYKKGTDFDLLTDDDVVRLQNRINLMPRKMFGFKSSYEINKHYIER